MTLEDTRKKPGMDCQGHAKLFSRFRVFGKKGKIDEKEMDALPVPEVKIPKVSTFERRNYEVSSPNYLLILRILLH